MTRDAVRTNVSLDGKTHSRLRKIALERSLSSGKRITISALIREWSKRIK